MTPLMDDMTFTSLVIMRAQRTQRSIVQSIRIMFEM